VNSRSSAKSMIWSKRRPGLARAEAEHRGVDADVVARRQVGVEADAELDERRHAPVDEDPPAVRGVDAGQALEQGRLARPVAPDDAEELAPVHGERSRP
jgi:hypothetical protein